MKKGESNCSFWLFSLWTNIVCQFYYESYGNITACKWHRIEGTTATLWARFFSWINRGPVSFELHFEHRFILLKIVFQITDCLNNYSLLLWKYNLTAMRFFCIYLNSAILVPLLYFLPRYLQCFSMAHEI